jgi:hypothetical protein
MRFGVAFLALLLAGLARAGDSDWNRLSRLSNKTVKVYVQDGRVLTGTIQQFRPDGLALASRGVAELKRENVLRVTTRARGLTAVIGAGILGAAVGIPVSLDKKSSPQITGLAVGVSAGVGAAIGAAIGHTITVYEVTRQK